MNRDLDCLGSPISQSKEISRMFAKSFVTPHSTMAIYTGNGTTRIKQPFTTDRQTLLNFLDSSQASGGHDIFQLLLGQPNGLLRNYFDINFPHAAILLTDTRYPDPSDSELNQIADWCNYFRVRLYILKLCSPGFCGPEDNFIQLVKPTGGRFYDICSLSEIKRAFEEIQSDIQGAQVGIIEWESDGCIPITRTSFEIPSLNLISEDDYYVPILRMRQLLFPDGNDICFDSIEVGYPVSKKISIQASNKAVNICKIINSNPGQFRITDFGGTIPPITLQPGEERTIVIEYNPVDTIFTSAQFELVGVNCLGQYFHASGGKPVKDTLPITLQIISPNGGEMLTAGSDTTITWKGVLPTEKVRLEFSTNAGTNWQIIKDSASGLQYKWRVPKLSSQQCIARVTTNQSIDWRPELVLVPPGTCLMGNITSTHFGDCDERPIHQITITKPFFTSKYEVTRLLWRFVMETNPGWFKGDSLPVEMVNWYDAFEFCNRLSKLENRDTCYHFVVDTVYCDFDAKGYRLPTEAEWEYACRAGTETDYYTGNMTMPWSFDADTNLVKAGWYTNNSGSGTHVMKVGLKLPNKFGLYDMHGNIMEMCWDWYTSIYDNVVSVKDPLGPVVGNARVLRGGYWGIWANECRSSSRSCDNLTAKGSSRGFRIVRTY